jgi:tRNA modification GTPase
MGLINLAILPISAKKNIGIDKFKDLLVNSQQHINIGASTTLVSNIRHYEALVNARTALLRVIEGTEQEIPTDLLTQDIREALFHIGEIVGEINTEEILGNIFSKFCIGK